MRPAEARSLFDSNAATYDGVNSTISLGLDARWRAWAAEQAVHVPGAHVLDAFAGTGLVGVACAKRGAQVTLADVSEGMLAIAQARAEREGVGDRVRVASCDLTEQAASAPVGAPFDAVTMMFGARYLEDPSAVIRCLASWLAPGGRLVLVDFVEPHGSVISRLAAAYFFRVLPRIASALAGKRELYDALVATTHEMGPSAHLLEYVTDAGLEVERTHLMGFGLVCGVVAARPVTTPA